MNGTAGRNRDTVCNQPVARRGQIGPAHSHMVGRHECVRKILQPVRIGKGVVIDIGDDFTRSGFRTRVARAAQAAVFGSDESKWVLPDDFSRVVLRSIVNNDDLIVGIFEPKQTFKTFADHAPAVITAQDYRDLRPLLVWGERNRAIGTANGRQRGFRAPFPVGQPERPVRDIVASAIPFVGPAKHESSGTALRERSPNLPIQKMGLLLLAVPNTIQSDLRQQKRPVAGNILKPRYVCAKRLLVFQINVDTEQIHKIQF